MEPNNNLRKLPKIHFWHLLVLAAIVFSIVVGALYVNNPTNFIPKAAVIQATLELAPTQLTLPPNGNVSLWLTADNLVGFAASKITFNPALVNLNQEVTVVSTNLTRVVKVTSMAEANQTGIITVALGLDPSMRSTPPTGRFELARFQFKPLTTAPNTLPLAIDLPASQVVSIDTSLFTLASINSTLTLNPTPIPSPIPTSIVPPTTTPSPKPSATPTPTPTSSDLTPPTVSITSPVTGTVINRNSTVLVTATAADNTTVAKVEFRINNKLVCTDNTTPYSCSVKVAGKPGTYTLSAKAYDPSGNNSTSTVTVTSQ